MKIKSISTKIMLRSTLDKFKHSWVIVKLELDEKTTHVPYTSVEYNSYIYYRFKSNIWTYNFLQETREPQFIPDKFVEDLEKAFQEYIKCILGEEREMENIKEVIVNKCIDVDKSDFKPGKIIEIENRTGTFNHVKIHNEIETTVTGAMVEKPGGKGRYDLISSIALHRLAQHCENGAAKYSARNWEKGLPLSRYLNSASRHLNKLIAGMEDEDHAAAVAWNIFCFIHTKELIDLGKRPKELNDLREERLEI